jgi:ribosome biogenesis GTPase
VPASRSFGGAAADPPEALIALGWSPRLDDAFTPHRAAGRVRGRVVRVDRGSAQVATDVGELRATPSPALFASADGDEARPVTGDWVALTGPPDTGEPDLWEPVIAAVLPRSSAFRRFRDGSVQVLAANVDVVLIVLAAGAEAGAGSSGRHRLAARPDGHLRRLDRELALAFESGAQPVIVVSKADLCPDLDAVVATVQRSAPSLPVHATSAATGEGIEALRAYASGNRTVALIGASGVGKSTIVNRLLGAELLATSAVRAYDGRGRHTTTARHLLALPGGGALIDTPGMRSLGLRDAEAAVGRVYADVEALAAECRFGDCAHGSEPGCAVQAALADGTLTPQRLAAYGKLQREAALAERKRDPRKQAEAHERQRATFNGYRKQAKQRPKSRWRED